MMKPALEAVGLPASRPAAADASECSFPEGRKEPAAPSSCTKSGLSASFFLCSESRYVFHFLAQLVKGRTVVCLADESRALVGEASHCDTYLHRLRSLRLFPKRAASQIVNY